MVHGSHAIQMIECVVNLLALFADERLNKTAIVIDTDHRRNIALQLRHLARSPTGEIAESHLVSLADDVVELVEHTEIDVVDLLHLVLQDFRLHDSIE